MTAPDHHHCPSCGRTDRIHTDCGNCGHPTRTHTRRRHTDPAWSRSYREACKQCACQDCVYVGGSLPLRDDEPELRTQLD